MQWPFAAGAGPGEHIPGTGSGTGSPTLWALWPGCHLVTGCALVCRVPGLVCILRGHRGCLHLDLPVAAEEISGLLHASYPR